MPIRLLLDEHLRGPLWHAIQRHNLRGGLLLDVARVGDNPNLPLGSDDAQILLWVQGEERILITEDRRSMAGHLAEHLQAGHRSPGIFVVALGCSLSQLVTWLELVAHAGDPADYQNGLTFVP